MDVLHWTCQSREMTEQMNWCGEAAITCGLNLGRSEMFGSFFVRSLRHYKRAQSQGQHAIDHPEGKGVESGTAQQSSA